MLNISLIADSLAMPRIEGGEKILIESTWPELLQDGLRKNFDRVVFSNFSERRRSIKTLKKIGIYNESIIFNEPQLIIIQIGIVDAAPRVFSLKEQAILNFRFFPNFIKKIIISKRSQNRNSLQRKNPLGKVYTDPDDFFAILINFMQKIEASYANVPKLILVPILGDLEKMELKSEGFRNNVVRYNNILKKIASKYNFISYLEEIGNLKLEYCIDNYHLSKKGHSLLSIYIQNWILKWHEKK
jgi:lysophospholipase L1-like esterase